MRISDWSSDVCSSDLVRIARGDRRKRVRSRIDALIGAEHDAGAAVADFDPTIDDRSEEHTSELQSLMRISYAVFCLKKKKKNQQQKHKKSSTHNNTNIRTLHTTLILAQLQVNIQ